MFSIKIWLLLKKIHCSIFGHESFFPEQIDLHDVYNESSILLFNLWPRYTQKSNYFKNSANCWISITFLLLLHLFFLHFIFISEILPESVTFRRTISVHIIFKSHFVQFIIFKKYIINTISWFYFFLFKNHICRNHFLFFLHLTRCKMQQKY